MVVNADSALDRRRLKRHLTVWRLLAVVAVVGLAFLVLDRGGSLFDRPHVARLLVQGLITEDLERERAVADIARNPSVKALLVHIDSPGGTVVGGESLFRALRTVAENKPVVAVMGELATSGGYMAALGADYIIARESSITGSIGVILQTVDVTELLSKIGIKPESVKSGPLKAQPNPLEPFTEEARRATESALRDTYDMFVGMVAERRRLGPEAAKALSDGRIFTGRQALAKGLIDALGGEVEARRWLSRTHGIGESLPLRDVTIERDVPFWSGLVGERIEKALFSERLRLDGLISLWHPDVW